MQKTPKVLLFLSLLIWVFLNANQSSVDCLVFTLALFAHVEPVEPHQSLQALAISALVSVAFASF